jgi:adenosylcobyric acid synthase
LIAETTGMKARGPTASMMLQGTGSDVGKSLLVAGLARAYSARGLKVMPFKPQNMSNNAAVAGAGEIGRAQALQARACRVAPNVHMNPVLLKPQSDRRAQIVVQGHVERTASAEEYAALKPSLLPRVLQSFHTLAADADLVLVEGAGSPAEVNLRQGDIANMGFAEAAGLPVLLVADIDRGGAIASIVGTHMLLEPGERDRLKGFLVNKFRGAPELFHPALGTIAARTGLGCLGIVPWFEGARLLPREDAAGLDSTDFRGTSLVKRIRIVVPRLPRIANFDDLDPLASEPGVEIVLATAGKPLPQGEVVLLVGSKATRADLAELFTQGWDIDIRAHRRRGGMVIGLCGGYQMLGLGIEDPGGIEGPAGASAGLGLLEVTTILKGQKRLVEIGGRETATGHAVAGYEMHVGATDGPGRSRPWFELAGAPEGAISPDGLVRGSYLHGVFASDPFRRGFLAALGQDRFADAAYEARVEATLDSLAAHLARHIDLDTLLEIARAR